MRNMIVKAVLADVVWPSLFLEQRLLSTWVIVAGLLIEWLVLWRGGFGLTWKKAVIVDVVMNFASTVVGIALVPLAGLAWEFLPGRLIYTVWHHGTFNPMTWIATLVLAVAITLGIEAMVVRGVFKILLGHRRFWTLAAANLATVSIAFVSVFVNPPKL
jgi:hypothetical protein